MEQAILIPERTVKHIINAIRLDIANKDDIIANVTIVVNEADRSNMVTVSVFVNQLFSDGITAGDLTAANITGLKKCLKAICANALNLSFTEINEVF